MGCHRLVARILITSVFIGLQLISPGRATASAPTSATGWWLDQTGRAGILITPCGNELCGRIEWLKIPLNPAGQPKSDVKNKDPALRSRPICGLPIVGNFAPDGPNNWTAGWIYNPDDGATYKSTMRLAADGTLHVRGYIGIPLLGKSEVWTRPAAPLPVCSGG